MPVLGAAVDGRGVGAGVANTSTHVRVGHVSPQLRELGLVVALDGLEVVALAGVRRVTSSTIAVERVFIIIAEAYIHLVELCHLS